MSLLNNCLSRRRFLHIVASSPAMCPLNSYSQHFVESQTPVIWRGTALGALASIELYHNSPAVAKNLIKQSLTELERLEKIFSLYRTESALSTLNRNGLLLAPPTDLLKLLSMCVTYHVLTHGAFDPSVQPLWELYASHFSVPDPDPDGPDESHIQLALSRVGLTKIVLASDRIVLAPGMGLTLNGIAQGYITDRVTDLLRAGGVEHVLVDLGEMRLIGRPKRRLWRVGLEDPDHPGNVAQTLEVEDCAIATSGGYGFHFDSRSKFTHLFDPHTGRSPKFYKSVSVVSPTATAADALSTAFATMPLEEIKRVLSTVGDSKAYLTSADGSKQSL
ncbi:MAG: FAD:protein FMN transferase [Hyphomicrobiales bacterium]|nr:MAG: FAD:protein FMN transferase [Hyphomicrobiales bacterium]